MTDFRHILITGGAGFVGSSLALSLRRDLPQVRVTALDNLMRRGSELNVPRLTAAGVDFRHGDVRVPDDLEAAGPFDLLIDCAAEPSVHAGRDGSPKPVFDTNLNGTIHSLEAARRHEAAFLFLSTSRVYPVAALNRIPYREEATRYRWNPDATQDGISDEGISETFPLSGARSYYGASKLASELIAQEYAAATGMRLLINRCGVLTGPWQMGKVDQGVIALWVLHHHFRQPLTYTGFGGAGRQVRDILHVEDLYQLLIRQMNHQELWNGQVYNVGGGEISVSLQELTAICRRVTETEVPVGCQPATSSVDLRIFVTDSRRAQQDFDWRPTRDAEQIVSETSEWVLQNRSLLSGVTGLTRPTAVEAVRPPVTAATFCESDGSKA